MTKSRLIRQYTGEYFKKFSLGGTSILSTSQLNKIWVSKLNVFEK